MKKIIACLLVILTLTGCSTRNPDGTIKSEYWSEGAPAGQACDSRYESCVIR